MRSKNLVVDNSTKSRDIKDFEEFILKLFILILFFKFSIETIKLADLVVFHLTSKNEDILRIDKLKQISNHDTFNTIVSSANKITKEKDLIIG